MVKFPVCAATPDTVTTPAETSPLASVSTVTPAGRVISTLIPDSCVPCGSLPSVLSRAVDFDAVAVVLELPPPQPPSITRSDRQTSDAIADMVLMDCFLLYQS